MPPRKRTAPAAEAEAEPVAKRRSSRRGAAAAAPKPALVEEPAPAKETQGKAQAKKEPSKNKKETETAKKQVGRTKQEEKVVKKEAERVKKEDPEEPAARVKKPAAGKAKDAKASAPKEQTKKAPVKKETNSKAKKEHAQTEKTSGQGASEDLDVDDIPAVNPEAPPHDGEWYWLMKAEPETRYENGIDVRFSIDDLRAKKKPEGWDGIRNYVARNHMRNMKLGDKAFFYHSNCKEPAIVGIMEIVKEFSEDKTALQPGTPYYDPKSSKDNPKWSLVHVEFRKKFAVPIGLKELRELGAKGGPLEEMQMLKQSRLSVSRVGGSEWEALCKLADQKAEEAGLKHETERL